MINHIQTFLTQNPFCAGLTAIFLLGAICGVLQTFIAGLYKNTIACLVFIGLVGYALVSVFPVLLPWLALTVAGPNKNMNAIIYIAVVMFAITCLDILMQMGHEDERIYSFRDLTPY